MTQRGFTLIELMTAVSIFLVVMTISMGSILGIFDANRKSRAMKNSITNLNLAMESMSREMRFGRNYHCRTSGDIPSVVPVPALDCDSAGGTFISFRSSEGQQITYRFNESDNSIEKRVDSGNFIPATGPDVTINSLRFFVVGGNIATLQSKVLITIRATSGIGKAETEFSLQTLVSQRHFEMP